MTIIGYLVANNDGRYLCYNQREGFHFCRVCEPYIFRTNLMAADHCKAFHGARLVAIFVQEDSE